MILAWPLLTLVGVFGWGWVGVALARRFGGVDLSPMGMCLAIGLALYLALSGLAVAFDGFSTTFVTVFVILGLGWMLAGGWVRAKRHGFTLPDRWRPTLSIGAALVGIVMLVAFWRTAHFLWNVDDDDAAYLYLTRRLLVVGNLLDPLNNRRLTSLGGLSALQALFLGRLPDTFLPFADVSFGSLLILTTLWRTRLARWSVWGIVAALAIILFPLTLGAGLNSSPIYLPVGLTVVTFSVALRMRTEVTTARGHLVCSVVLGLLASSATLLRPQFGPPVVILALAAAAWPAANSRAAVRLGGLVAALTASLAPWTVASWRAVGTPLFPLLTGNGDPSWPSLGPVGAAGPSVTEVLSRVAGVLVGSGVGLGLLSSAAIALVFYFWQRGRSPNDAVWAVRLSCVLALSSLLVLAFLADQWYALGSPLSYARFWAPAMAASAAIPLVVINARRVAIRGWMASWSAAALASVVVATAAAPVAAGQFLVTVAADTVSGKVGNQLSADRYALVRSDYDHAAALIPRGSKVLAAVDDPSLLLEAGLDVNTIDIPGSTSPPPYLPYFGGDAQKVSWLHANGYDYVIAVDSTQSIRLYNRAHWLANFRYGGHYGAWAPYFLDWFDFVQDMSAGKALLSGTVTSLIVLKV